MTSTYWAAADTTEIGKKLQAKLDVCQQALNDSEHLKQVGNAYLHYFGRDVEGVGASASTIVRSGEQGELAEVRVPLARALANGVLNIVVGPKLSWSATALNNDFESRAACVTTSNILEYYWKDRQVSATAAQAALGAVVFGEGFVFNPWNPEAGEEVAAIGNTIVRSGDLDFRYVPTWDVTRDPSYKSYEAPPWIAVDLHENKFDVAARYPGKVDEVLSKSGSGTRWTPSGVVDLDSDCVTVTYFFHKRTPGLPRGRETVLVDGRVLSDGALHPSYWKYLPVHRLASGDLTGTPFPYAPFWSALGIQQVSDSIHSSLSTNITTTAPGLISAEQGSELDPGSLAGGPKVLYRPLNSTAPTAIQLQQASPESFRYLQVLQTAAQQLTGLNATTLGQPEGANLSGAAMALLSSMSIQANSDLQTRWAEFVARIGNSTLHQIQHRMPTPRKIALAGKGRAHLVKATEFSGPMLKGVDRVLVEIGNPLQQTPAGRYELAQLHIQAGFLKTPEQLQAVIETGRTDPLTQDLSNQLLLIAQENEMIAKGENPPVSLYDDHRLHLREHPGVSSSMEARMDPRVMEALQAHNDEHIRALTETDPVVLMAIGQEPLQLPPGPNAPPSGDPGAMPPPLDGAAPDVNLPSMPENPLTGEPAGPVAGTPPLPPS